MGADFIHGPAQRHGAVAAHAAVGGAQPDGSALRAGRNDRPERLRAQRKSDQPSRGGRAEPADDPLDPRSYSPRARAASVGQGLLVVPREPDVALRQRAHGELADEHRARFIEPLHAGGVGFGNALLERLGAPGGGDALGVEKVFHAERNAVQRAAIFARP